MGLQRAYSNALFAYTKAYKTIDKWTNPSSSSSGCVGRVDGDKSGSERETQRKRQRGCM
jgi:hypothetical protein